MSGQLVAGSPWTRATLSLLDPTVRDAIESLIPEGHRIVVAAGRNRQDLTLILRSDAGEVRRVQARSIESGCERLLLSETVR